MRFFLDQCVPKSIGTFLTSERHQVLLLRDYLPADAPDAQVIRKAQRMNAILVSLNGDFADLIRYPPSRFKGIIGLQVRNRPEAIPHLLQKLKNYFQNHTEQKDYEGKLILVEPHCIRVR